MSEKEQIPGKGAADESRYSKVPDAYFDGLAENIIKRIESQPQTGSVKPKFSLKIWLPLAAAAMLIAGVFIFRQGPAETSDLQLQTELASLSEEEIIEELIKDPVTEDELVANLPEVFSDSLINLQPELLEEELGSARDIEILIDEL